MKPPAPKIKAQGPPAMLPQGPGRGPGPQVAAQAAQPQAPGGGGFLINHNAFSDVRPPQSRGMKKSAGYPNFPRNP